MDRHNDDDNDDDDNDADTIGGPIIVRSDLTTSRTKNFTIIQKYLGKNTKILLNEYYFVKKFYSFLLHLGQSKNKNTL